MRLKPTIFFIVLATCAGVAQVQAQNQIPNLASSKAIAPPDYALNRIPKGGKSRFYGAAFFGVPLNEEVRFHFYQWPQLNPPPDDGAGRRRDSDQNYRVDIFVRERKKGARFHLMQTVDIESSAFGSEVFMFNNVDLSANYLVPREPRIPMINLRCTVYGGFYGPFGTDLIMVFTKGWNKEPYIKALKVYGDHSEAVDPYFSLDESGITQLMLRRTISAADATTLEFWPWDGEKFTHTEDEISGSDVRHPGRYPVKQTDR